MTFDWEKFKKSNVARIFVAYAVVVFASMQILDYLLPIIEAPLWVAQTLTIVLFLGFPISLLIGWATQRSGSDSPEIGPTGQTAGSYIPRQKLIMLGLASSVLFGFLGLILMPYLLDQASYAPQPNGEATLSQVPQTRGVRTELNLGFTGVHPFWGFRTQIALSPDGTKIVFLNQTQSGGEIMIRDLLSIETPRVLASYSGAGVGFFSFSSDGEWVVFKTDQSLQRVRVEGGAPQSIADNPHNGGVYATDQHAFFTDRTTGNLMRASIIGNAQPDIVATEEGKAFFWPQLLPDGIHLLVTSVDNALATASTSQTQIIDLKSLERETLIEAAFNARYSSSGHIVFSRDAAVWAVPFDASALTLEGDQVPVLLEVETDQRRGTANYTFSESGRLAYLRGDTLNETSGALNLVRFGRDAEVALADIESQQFGHLSMSPNERQVALTIYENAATSDIWIWDLNRDILGRRTFEGNAKRPIWTTSGRDIIYSVTGVDDPNQGGLWTIAANGTSQPSPIFPSRDVLWPRTIDSKNKLLFTMHTGPVGSYSLDLTPSEEENITEERAVLLELMPQVDAAASLSISPDENWLAYVSIETGIPEVYVRPYPDVESGKWQASIGGGVAPLWNKSDSELFYGYQGQQFSVRFREEELDSDGRPTYIEFDRPTSIGQVPILGGTNFWNPWSYSSDRDEFIAVTGGGAALNQAGALEALLAEQVSLIVIEDWFSELKSLAPKFQN